LARKAYEDVQMTMIERNGRILKFERLYWEEGCG
jgi:hypothetical protein